jgi:hypothetical protein
LSANSIFCILNDDLMNNTVERTKMYFHFKSLRPHSSLYKTYNTDLLKIDLGRIIESLVI